MSPRKYAQRTAATAVALVATLAVGVTASQATDAAGQKKVIDASESQVGTFIAAEIGLLQGQQVLARRSAVSPWHLDLQPNTAWLISPYLIERQKYGRWSKKLA
jgi:hypothetical protein